MADQPDKLALASVSALGDALWHYWNTGEAWALDQAFAEARAVAGALRDECPAPAGDLDEPRWLVQMVPAVSEMAELSAREAERFAAANLAALWASLALSSAPPRWTEAERAAAHLAVLVAVTAPEEQSLARMRAALRRIAAGRVGRLLTEELGVADEETWRLALGARYASIAHRCAPRTRFRVLGLRAVMAGDKRLGEALAERLAGWLRSGAPRDDLPAVIEAVLVNHRTPHSIA